jgi:hypothetical protein
MLTAWDLTTPIHPDDLRIDNSDLAVEDVCRRIAAAFDLR